MKRRDLIRELVSAGCYLKLHGSSHDVYLNPNTGKKAPIPRQSQVKETLAELIRKQLGIK